MGSRWLGGGCLDLGAPPCLGPCQGTLPSAWVAVWVAGWSPGGHSMHTMAGGHAKGGGGQRGGAGAEGAPPRGHLARLYAPCQSPSACLATWQAEIFDPAQGSWGG